MQPAVSVSGSYMGYKASLQVDVKKFKESMSDKTKFGDTKLVLTSGGADMPEPIAIKLVPIDVAMQTTFFRSLTRAAPQGCAFTAALLASKRAAVKKALVEYPKKKGAIKPVGRNACPTATVFFAHMFNSEHKIKQVISEVLCHTPGGVLSSKTARNMDSKRTSSIRKILIGRISMSARVKLTFTSL